MNELLKLPLILHSKWLITMHQSYVNWCNKSKRAFNTRPISFSQFFFSFNFLNFLFSFQVDPCAKIHCGAGRVCEADGTTAECVCIPECPKQTDPRRMVCTNKNQTWNSDCEVHRERCLCDTDDARCKSADLKHIHINYYGECKEIQVSSKFLIFFFNFL